MKVLVTGGAGYVGWSVVHALAKSPSIQEIVVYDNFARRNYGLLLGGKGSHATQINTVVDDVLNSKALKKAVKGVDCVIHLAAISPSPFGSENPHTFDQVNHWGTAEVCYAVEAAGVPRLVYLSSGSVYGYSDTAVTTDTTPMPVNAYGQSKLAGEMQVQRLADKLEVVIVRSGTVYGVNPSARFDTFVNRFLLDSTLGRSLQVNGSGDQVRPVIGVDNLAKRVLDSVLDKKTIGLTHAVDLNISVNEVIDALSLQREPLDVIYINQQQRLSDLRLVPHDVNADKTAIIREFSERIAADLSSLKITGEE